MSRLVVRSRMPSTAEALYAWHLRPGAFVRLSPPWDDVRLLEQTGSIEDSTARLTISIPMGPFRKRWVAQHEDTRPGRSFKDVQVSGPFAKWEHTHRFLPEGEEESVLEDSIEYRLPLEPLSRWIAGRAIERDLNRVFAYRHRTTLSDLKAHQRYEGMDAMKVLITGSSGLVGGELMSFLQTGGHEIVRLRRGGGSPSWDPEGKGIEDPSALEGIDAVVHLAGESIANGRWTAAQKERIRSSRIGPTRLLAETLAGLENKPKVLVSASAIGFYGDRGDEVLEESSASGEGFLASVCRGWEEATEPASAAGIRVVNLRIGVVLSPKGGALAEDAHAVPHGRGRRDWQRQSVHELGRSRRSRGHHPPRDHDRHARGAGQRGLRSRDQPRVHQDAGLRPEPAHDLSAPRLRGEARDGGDGGRAPAVERESGGVEAQRSSGYSFRHADLESALRHQLGR